MTTKQSPVSFLPHHGLNRRLGSLSVNVYQCVMQFRPVALLNDLKKLIKTLPASLPSQPANKRPCSFIAIFSQLRIYRRARSRPTRQIAKLLAIGFWFCFWFNSCQQVILIGHFSARDVARARRGHVTGRIWPLDAKDVSLFHGHVTLPIRWPDSTKTMFMQNHLSICLPISSTKNVLVTRQQKAKIFEKHTEKTTHSSISLSLIGYLSFVEGINKRGAGVATNKNIEGYPSRCCTCAQNSNHDALEKQNEI